MTLEFLQGVKSEKYDVHFVIESYDTFNCIMSTY